MVSLVINNLNIIDPQFATIITAEVESPIPITWDMDDSSMTCAPIIEESTV